MKLALLLGISTIAAITIGAIGAAAGGRDRAEASRPARQGDAAGCRRDPGDARGCWIHSERLVHKLETFTDQQYAAQQHVRGLIWWFYADPTGLAGAADVPLGAAADRGAREAVRAGAAGAGTAEIRTGLPWARIAHLLGTLKAVLRGREPYHCSAHENRSRARRSAEKAQNSNVKATAGGHRGGRAPRPGIDTRSESASRKPLIDIVDSARLSSDREPGFCRRQAHVPPTGRRLTRAEARLSKRINSVEVRR
jgi:hypothetical protein